MYNSSKLNHMAIVKVIELLAESNKGWEDAAQNAVAEAAKTLHNIRSIYIKDFNAEVEDGKVTKWRLNCKISFEKDGSK
jgi:flavin-binding protein dodecin